jgi:transcriptional regulator with XRE-family HTH domain
VREEPALEQGEHASGALGAQLRALRRSRGLTLAQLAAGTNISKSFLSLLEAGKSDITVGRLMRLTDFYGISVSDILPEASDPEVVAVGRKGESKLLSSPSEGIRDYLLTPDTRRAMLPFIGVFEPGGKNREAAEHEGEEFAYVLEGTFSLQILDEGDSVYFPAHLPHSYANRASRQSRLLCIVTPPHV